MFCKQCRYNLKANDSGLCPECGNAFDPDNPETFHKYPIPAWQIAIVRVMILFDRCWMYALLAIGFCCIAIFSDDLGRRILFGLLFVLELWSLVYTWRHGPWWQQYLAGVANDENH